MKKTKTVKPIFYAIIIASFLATPVLVRAATATEDTVINAQISSTISITTSGTVALPITPTTGGSQTTAADTVTVATNNATGYNLSIRDSDANTNLVNGSNNIAAHAGTVASPSVLANNTWGFRVDGGTFGAGPTSGSVDQPTNAATFAGVTSSAVQIKTTTTTAAADVTSVFFSAKANTSLPNGTYTGTVLYTATTNP